MTRTQNSSKTYRLVLTALLAALVVVMQVISAYVKFGPFSITLTLIPLVVGAILLGPKQGTVLGALFGLVVYIFCIAGVDVGGNVLFTANPFLTGLICLLKGAAAGLVSALVYKALSKVNFVLAVILAAAVAPVVNTGLFILGMLIFFSDILTEWAAGTATLTYIFTGLVGINFLVEFGVNLVFSPAIASVIRAVRKDVD